MDEEKLKLALSKELPELITYSDKPKGIWKDDNPFRWKDMKPVSPREWEWVMREVETKLSRDYKSHRWTAYEAILLGAATDKKVRSAAILSWQTRAIAYFKTIGKEIE